MQDRDATTMDWYRSDPDEVARAHGVELDHGLNEDEAARRAQVYGPNELADGVRRSAWRLLLDQFTDFMILVLVGAAMVAAALGDVVDTLAILVIVVINGLVGFVQAWRADRALAALQRLAAVDATVVREGKVRRVAATALVPGDVVLVEAGNQIPADLRLAQVARLLVDESALTGESVGVEKNAQALEAGAPSLGDRLNMAFKGTTAARGRGRGIVVATGMATELGKVAGLMAAGERDTPLQRRLAAFGRRLAFAVLGICVLMFAIGVIRDEPPLLMLLTAVSLAVAAIPEALPAVVTVLLALGARRMVSLHALVRRLPSVETLGSVTFICSDKTGTLTQNRMRVEEVVASHGSWSRDAPGGPGQGCSTILRAAALCNDATADVKGGGRGDPTEIALLDAAGEAGLSKAELDRLFPRIQELPFDSQRKCMTTFHRAADGVVAFTKGAPESVVPLCTTRWAADGCDAFSIARTLSAAESMAARGLRVLAVAQRHHRYLPDPDELESAEQGLELLGLVGLMDPPRDEAFRAVRECVGAGVTPVMITGDHPATALAIARALGIAAADAAPGPGPLVLTGSELGALDDAALRDRVRTVRVYARVDPAQKIRIVEALQSRGEFVAMTGDGVNDAPALKRADIGVAMGRGGTDVAREASSLVLLDDNFATIVAAVREGRRIYDNVRKFVRYAMTGNSGEIWTMFLAPVLGLPIPLLPIHILWINLVTDGLPGLALAAEPAERGIMLRPPRAPAENLFAHGMGLHILLVGLLVGALCLAVQAWALATMPGSAQTMVFTTLTLAQMAHVLAVRSERDALWRLGLCSNRPLLGAVCLTVALQMATVYIPWLQPVFRTVPLGGFELAICVAAALVVLLVVEIEKACRRSTA